MPQRTIIWLYTLTLTLSAYLLFSIEPLFAKMILPLLGGSPSVWNTAMVFFQVMLLAGYAFTHFTSRHVSWRAQAAVQLGLMVIAGAIFLPVALPTEIHPGPAPVAWQLGVMASVLGLPFFTLATLAPMLQRWFAVSGHEESGNPYFLYAASNAGSMAALLLYPTVIEPMLTVSRQSSAWAGGYVALAALTAACAFAGRPRDAIVPYQQSGDMRPGWKTRFSWIALAAVPASLMLGVTSFITTDLAAMPLLWVVPLVLYLLSFILVFSRRTIVSSRAAMWFFTVMISLLVFVTSAGFFQRSLALLALHLLCFFSAAVLCHKKLADLRPEPRHLTGFYMDMAVGGAVGGMFNALLAPVIFVLPVEYVALLCAALMVRAYIQTGGKPVLVFPQPRRLAKSPGFWQGLAAFLLTSWAYHAGNESGIIAGAALALAAMAVQYNRPLGFAFTGMLFLLINSPLVLYSSPDVLKVARNFFGVLRVVKVAGTHELMNGTTLHGAQPIDEKYRLMPVTYYNPLGPLGDIFAELDRRMEVQGGPQKIAAIGLGVGTIACYNHSGRSVDFYEINPAVPAIAQDKRLFTYLSGCGTPYSIVLGDGRLNLESAPDASYDAIILDAFSSDTIPTHLITREAFELYMRKVKANGVIIFNASNRYIDLEPQLAALSQSSRVPAIARFSDGRPLGPETMVHYSTSFWIAFTPDPDILVDLRTRRLWRTVKGRAGFRMWTDDYADIVSALRVFFNPELAR